MPYTLMFDDRDAAAVSDSLHRLTEAAASDPALAADIRRLLRRTRRRITVKAEHQLGTSVVKLRLALVPKLAALVERAVVGQR